MVYLRSSAILLLLLHTSLYFLSASSIGGSPDFFAYPTVHQVFHDNDSAVGVIRLSNGFSIVGAVRGTNIFQGATTFFDGEIYSAGAIDLRETGTLALLSPLYLEPTTTFSSGGIIKGYGAGEIVMLGNLTIPDNTTLHIRNSLLWNGCGRELLLGANAQIMLDADTTLTMYNMRIRTTKSQPGAPALVCTTTTDKLVFENVECALADDWYFNRGQLFIQGDVVITGTSSFRYRSTSPCWIAGKSTLAFELGTTFDFAPSSTGTPGLPAKDLLIMADETSVIYLNGCTLNVSNTGLRLTKGTIFFDNDVTVSVGQLQIRSNDITALDTQAFNSSASVVCWSPDGRYVVVGGVNSTSDIIIYYFDGATLTPVVTQDYGSGNGVFSADWSPDGHYLAVAGDNGSEDVTVYLFGGTSLTIITTQDFSGVARAVAWSPDGRYLATGGNNGGTNDMVISIFNGAALIPVATQNVTQTDPSHGVWSLAWSPDGYYVAVGTSNATSVNLFVNRFINNTFTLVTTAGSANAFYGLAWSSDGRYLVVAGSDPINSVIQYQFTGTNLVFIASIAFGGAVYSISLTPDGRYVAIGGNSGTTTDVRIYAFDGTNFSLVTTQALAGTSWSVAFGHNGTLLAVGGVAGTVDVAIYAVGYRYDDSVQVITNGLAFGNSAIGPTVDVSIALLADAQVDTYGIIAIDQQ